MVRVRVSGQGQWSGLGLGLLLTRGDLVHEAGDEGHAEPVDADVRGRVEERAWLGVGG